MNRSRIAIKDISDGDCSFNYGQIESKVFAFANALTSSERFKTGSHVGLCFPNSAEYVVAFYGTLVAGGVVVPLPFYETQNKLTELCKLANLNFVACGSEVSRFDELFSPSSELDERPVDSIHSRPVACMGSDSLAMLMFTSGSTGSPKAVMLSHRNLLSNCDSICEYLPITNEDRALAVMPFCHAFGNSVMQTHLLNGAGLAVGCNKSFSTAIIEAIQRHGCTSLSAVPEVFDNLANVSWNDEVKQQLKYMSVAGGPMDPNRAKSLCKNIKPASFYIMYGQTEATARLAYVPPAQLTNIFDTDNGSDATTAIGYPIPGVQLEIRSEAGAPAELGSPGMLYAKGDNIMLGYWQDHSATADTLVDGWLQTGDLAVLRDNGLFQLCGRSSNLLKIQGHRIHPQEIEQRVMLALPHIRAIAVGFEFYGKTRLALFVVENDDNRSPTTPQALRSVCKETLPAHMVPQRFKILEQWPLNAAGKVDRPALRKSLSMHPTSSRSSTNNYAQTPTHILGE